MKDYNLLSLMPIHYNKILKCIKSCENRNHLAGCGRMIDTYNHIFDNKTGFDQLQMAFNKKFLKILKNERTKS